MNLFLTQQGGILGPFAWILGIILNAIYEFVSLLGIYNIAICIILFTFVTKMLMLPITIKQQKFTRLSAKMNPELTKIQAKYKNKKDPESIKKQQAETQEVYNKYGTNPMGGCLPMLITMPILFALYRVVYAIPAYINDINEMYNVIAVVVSGVENYSVLIKDFLEANSITISVKGFGDVYSITHLIDIFSKFSPENFSEFFKLSEFITLSDTIVTVSNSSMTISAVIDQITHVHSFLFGLSILQFPGWGFPGIIIPIIAMILYFIQNKLMTTNTKTDVDNPAAQSMKTMNTVMPVISGVFCVFVPIGLGTYWIAGSAFQIIQQIFINRYMDHVDMDELIEKQVEKSNKRKQKLGIDTGSRMASLAKTTTKSIDTSEKISEPQSKTTKTRPEASNYKKSDVSYKAGSIAANANLLKDRNKEKGDK